MTAFTQLKLQTNQNVLQAADLDWRVVKRPLYDFHDAKFHNTGTFGLFREDTDEYISDASKRYHPFQNEDVVNFFEDYVTKAGGTVTHGGHYKNRDILLFGNLGHTVNLGNGNDAEFKLLARTGHYPGMALEILIGVLMCACTNQFTPKMDISNRGFYYQWHNTEFTKINKDGVAKTLDWFKNFITNYQTQAQALMAKPMTTPRAETFLIEHIGDTTKVKADQPKAVTNILNIYDSTAYLGPNDKREATAWRLWNSITQYIDHIDNQSMRKARSAMIGTGQTIKQKTFQALLEV
jgi:hypothetical protein